MELTPKTPVHAGDIPNLMCIISQGELFSMRGTIESCHAVLQQIANQQGHGVAHFDLADGNRVVVPTQTALAMAALTHIFGVQWNAIDQPGEQATDPLPPAEPEEEMVVVVEDEPPARTPWKPMLVQGGKQ